jgi:hypothetical protein
MGAIVADAAITQPSSRAWLATPRGRLLLLFDDASLSRAGRPSSCCYPRNMSVFVETFFLVEEKRSIRTLFYR